jgi:hypothetical protein
MNKVIGLFFGILAITPLFVHGQLHNSSTIFGSKGSIISTTLEIKNKGKMQVEGTLRSTNHLQNDGRMELNKLILENKNQVILNGKNFIDVNELDLGAPVMTENNLKIRNYLNFSNNGMIETSLGSSLILGEKAQYSNYSNENFVSGSIVKDQPEDFVFPFGSNHQMTPLKISNKDLKKAMVTLSKDNPRLLGNVDASQIEEFDTQYFKIEGTSEISTSDVDLSFGKFKNNLSFVDNKWSPENVKSNVQYVSKGNLKSKMVIDEPNSSEYNWVRVFPNPSYSGEFKIEINPADYDKQVHMSVVDLKGNSILEAKGLGKELQGKFYYGNLIPTQNVILNFSAETKKKSIKHTIIK